MSWFPESATQVMSDMNLPALPSRRLALMLVTALLTACAHEPVVSKPPPDLDVTRLINDKAQLAVDAQRELTAAAYARLEQDAKAAERLSTDRISLDFVGELETMLTSLANKYSYELVVLGKRPPQQVLVNVYVKDRSVIDILKNVGLQVDAMADVRLDRSARRIELIYKEIIARR
ncbi:DotD/TraH family lipoprotein [Parachitinimonas caeni]|uniref:DotD/TraH family lipoprotein n=1 Tax=Parachitinimonas caeni TaxID=3031301 RepID=A0ABT7DYX4_9NEIS|nr:DotD/TraH family lipoprotein [Parachitinimonas caeni]MDK2123867.1 DotD/TraH family lipoprotein [Parachitinimonas caeni]